MEVLFEARREIAGVSGKLNFVQAKAKPHPEAVVRCDTFVDGSGASCWGSVLHDGGRYRMWYQAWPKDWGGRDVSLCAYAESDDGFSWRKPPLGIVEYGPGPNHLVNLGMHCPSVFIDPHAPPSCRYRATGCIHPRSPGANPGAQSSGYYSAHSADGLHWELDTSQAAVAASDTIKSIWHPGRNCGIVALKRLVRVRSIPRRSIYTSEIIEGQWSEPVMALIPDDFDDVAAQAQGFASADYYSMGMLPSGKGTIAFIEQFRHTLPRTPGWETGVFGAVDVTLAYQANRGDCWLHSPGRPNFLTHGDPEWARGGLYMSSGPVEANGEHRLYFSGAKVTHGWYIDANWKVIDRRQKELLEIGHGDIGVAIFPRFRLFGFEADPEGVLTLRLDPLSKPSELRLNFQAKATGSLRVELPELEGFNLEQAKALTGDYLEAPAAWTNGHVIPATNGQPLTVKLHLDCATVWAFEPRAVQTV